MNTHSHHISTRRHTEPRAVDAVIVFMLGIIGIVSSLLLLSSFLCDSFARTIGL